MKICPKCNAQLADDIKFCNSCGTAVSDVAPVADNNAPAAKNSASDTTGTPFPGPIFNGTPNNSQAQGMPQSNMNNNMGNNMGGSAPQPGMNPLFSAPPAEEPKKKNNTGLFLIIGGVAACFVIALIVVLALVLGGGYKKPINKLVSLVNSKSTDINAYMNCISPSFISETYKEALGLIKGGDAKSELTDTINDAADEAWDSLKDEFGKDWKVSVEFKKNKKMSDKDLEKLQNNYDSLAKTLEGLDLDDEDTWEDIADWLDDEYDTELNTAKAAKMGENLLKKLDNFKITEGYEVKVKVNIEGKDKKESETMEANVIKANGQWFIDPLSFSEGGVSASSLMYMLDDIDLD